MILTELMMLQLLQLKPQPQLPLKQLLDVYILVGQMMIIVMMKTILLNVTGMVVLVATMMVNFLTTFALNVPALTLQLQLPQLLPLVKTSGQLLCVRKERTMEDAAKQMLQQIAN